MSAASGPAERDGAARAAARRALLGATSFESAAEAACAALAPSVGTWCELEIDEGTTPRRFTGGVGPVPADLADGVAAARERAVRTAAATTLGGAPGALLVVAPVLGQEGPIGTLLLATDHDDAVAVVEHVADLVAAVYERTALRERTREAARHAQRVASQLHQLLAASIAVSALQDDQEILSSVAQRVRSVFDADVALAGLVLPGADGPCVACLPGSRSSTTTVRAATERFGLPSGARNAVAARVETPWLLAPMLARRSEAQGWIAVRRDGSPFSDDDVEVVTLLAQTAASALASARLHRSVTRSEARLRALVDAAPVAVVEHDRAGGVRFWNRAASALLSWPDPGEGAPSFPPSLHTALGPIWQEVAAGASVVGRELTGVELGTSTRHLTVGVVELPDAEGRAGSLLTVAEDVTDHRQLMEELRHAQRMEVIGQLSSSVAHDFNNLLTLIAGYAELLAHELPQDAPSARGHVADIQATTSRASTLTGKLLTMGRTKLPEPVVFSPASSLRGIGEVLARIVGRDVRLELSVDDSTPPVRADPDQFEQMVMNLATNARDAMPEGGELRIRLEPAGDPDSPTAHLTVSDTGTGMDEATLARCFEPLFTTKGPSRGTGLGLPAARRVVTEAGGSIRCSSEPGKGTTFDVTLPGAPDGLVEDRPAERASDAVRRDGTVLLVEDEAGILGLVERVLTRGGFDVVTAGSAEDALALAEELGDGVDLLVSDVVMGGITGQQLAVDLQARWPELRVVLMSGNVDATAIAELEDGTASFLAKPFRPSALLEVIDELFAREGAPPD